MKKLAVLISNVGTGSNLAAMIDAVKSKELKAEIVVVITSDQDAYGLKRAEENNIPQEIVIDQKKLLATLKRYKPDYICMAGWKKIVPAEIINLYTHKILNVHPGLIPDSMDGSVLNPDGTKGLWNKGKLTDVAIANFLDNNATYAGSSIHFLSNEFDFGKVLERGFEKINNDDNVESLYKRLKKIENELYVNALVKLCNGR